MNELYLQPDNTVDVLSVETMKDYTLFFGPIIEGTTPLIISAKRISDVLIALNLAQSKTWCRKNNWDWEIPQGYSEVTFGMKKVKLCIYIEHSSETN
jgi:hypothetical protein